MAWNSFNDCRTVKGSAENMKRLMTTATLLLLCILLPTALEARGVKRYLKKESTVDMKNMNHIFLGWVDLNPDSWVLYQHEGTLWNRGALSFSRVANRGTCLVIRLPRPKTRVTKTRRGTTSTSSFQMSASTTITNT